MAEKRDTVVRFRCTQSQRKKIERMAKPYGSISKFILTTILTDKKMIIEPKEFLQGMDELTLAVNRVGNNINQIARFLNTTKDINNYELLREWFDLFSEYNKILNKVDLKYEDIFQKMFL